MTWTAFAILAMFEIQVISIFICRIRIVVGKKIRHYKNADHQEEKYLVEKISVQVGTDLH